MKVFFKELTVSTHKRREVVDITRLVEEAVAESGIENGICLIHAPHATAAIVLNEAEPGLMKDLEDCIEKLIPWDGGWRHNMIDDNAAAHLASAMIGAERILPVRNGRLVRGTWQNVLLVELDGPRVRRVVVEVMGE